MRQSGKKKSHVHRRPGQTGTCSVKASPISVRCLAMRICPTLGPRFMASPPASAPPRMPGTSFLRQCPAWLGSAWRSTPESPLACSLASGLLRCPDGPASAYRSWLNRESLVQPSDSVPFVAAPSAKQRYFACVNPFVGDAAFVGIHPLENHGQVPAIPLLRKNDFSHAPSALVCLRPSAPPLLRSPRTAPFGNYCVKCHGYRISWSASLEWCSAA